MAAQVSSDRSTGWLGVALACGGLLVGCGGAPMAAKSADPSAEAPSSPGYGQPSGAPVGGAADLAPMSPQAASPMPPPPGDAPREEAKRSEARPGLGTEWGETRLSRITTVPFHRADPATPFATAAVFYNDLQGARAMAGGSSMLPQRSIDVGDGVVSVGLKDGSTGRFLSGFESAGRDYVVGEPGQRYVIVVQNQTPMRLEVVVSVDGLDVIDGRPAGFGKRGYLVDGHGTLEIDGFRQSEEAVASFRFGSVRDSYVAQKGGDARNVGVIGVALFHEQGTSPALFREEARRRHGADPFPGRFATPPPGH